MQYVIFHIYSEVLSDVLILILRQPPNKSPLQQNILGTIYHFYIGRLIHSLYLVVIVSIIPASVY